MSAPDYILTTPRLGLRLWQTDDLVPFSQLNADDEVMRYFPNTLTSGQTREFFDRIQAAFDEKGYGLWATELLATREFIGFVGFSHPRFDEWFTPCVEIGWRLRRDMWGRGIAPEGAAACLRYGFDTLGFDKIYSFTATNNLPSERVMRKIGMEKAGEFNHPNIEPNSPLRRHVLYRIVRNSPTNAGFT